MRRPFGVVSLLTIILCYAFLKAANLSTFTGDQGVYFYSGFLWSQGVMPYRDFFISHPPIQLLIPTLTIFLTGVHLPFLQLLPAFFGALSGVLLLFLTWKTLGSLRAILSTALFLLSYATLLSTLHYTGQNLSTLLLLLSIFLFLRRQKFASGLLLGFAQSAGIHILFPFLALSILQFRWKKKNLPTFAGGFALSTGAMHLLFTILTGENFFRMVYLYHLKKPDAPSALIAKWQVMSQMLSGHFLLVTFALFGVFLLWKSLRGQNGEENPEKQRLLFLSATIAGTYLLYLSLIAPIFPHYFAPLMPFVAILAAEGIAKIGGSFFALWKKGQKGGALLAGVILILCFIASASRTLTYYSYEQRALAFESAPEVAARIQKELRPDDTIFGDFGVVPTIALLSDRRIAANQVDSSVMRFASGLYVLEDVIKAIEEDHVKAIITRKEKDIAYFPPFQEYLRTHYRLLETFTTPGRGVPIELWLHL